MSGAAMNKMGLSDEIMNLIESLKPEYMGQNRNDLMAECSTLHLKANRSKDPMESICCFIRAEAINEILEDDNYE